MDNKYIDNENRRLNTVDAVMKKFARDVLLEHGDYSEIVLVTGDKDFSEVVTKARGYKVRVTVVTTRSSAASRYIGMARGKKIELILMDKVDGDNPPSPTIPEPRYSPLELFFISE